MACTTTACTTPCTTASCSAPCTSGGCTNNCSRLTIAKRSIFNILDDNNDGTINSTDETSLGVRLGYMRFYNCHNDDTGNSYTERMQQPDQGDQLQLQQHQHRGQAESATGGTPI